MEARGVSAYWLRPATCCHREALIRINREPLKPEKHGGLRDRGAPGQKYAVLVRKRWFSRRALLLHFEFSLLASACLAAAWWQVTRALAGNGLSWFYTAEWPGFALIGIFGWWHLIHEDPEAYRARKNPPPEWDAKETLPDT